MWAPNLPYQRAVILREQNQLDSAANLLDEALTMVTDQLMPQCLVYFEFLHSQIALNRGDFDTAETAIERIEYWHFRQDVSDWHYMVPEPELMRALLRAAQGQIESLLLWTYHFGPGLTIGLQGCLDDQGVGKEAGRILAAMGVEVPRQARANDPLSERERQILDLLESGRSNPELAREIRLYFSISRIWALKTSAMVSHSHLWPDSFSVLLSQHRSNENTTSSRGSGAALRLFRRGSSDNRWLGAMAIKSVFISRSGMVSQFETISAECR